LLAKIFKPVHSLTPQCSSYIAAEDCQENGPKADHHQLVRAHDLLALQPLALRCICRDMGGLAIIQTVMYVFGFFGFRAFAIALIYASGVGIRSRDVLFTPCFDEVPASNTTPQASAISQSRHSPRRRSRIRLIALAPRWAGQGPYAKTTVEGSVAVSCRYARSRRAPWRQRTDTLSPPGSQVNTTNGLFNDYLLHGSRKGK
jgi:hypothetical protein